jgi:drug/metabolite transporter (DMT)-like permease
LGRLYDHVWIVLTVALATYSQLVLRWQMSIVGALPSEPMLKIASLASVALRPWVISALFATFCSGLSWMVVLSKFELTYAFPFTALTFLLILAAGVLVLGETLSTGRVIGTLLIVCGVVSMALADT